MFYIFHGDDALSQKEYLNERLLSVFDDPAMLDLNTTRFGPAVTLRELRQACQTVPFLAPLRIVLVQDFLGSKPGKEVVQELVGFLPELPPTTRLIFLESTKLPDNHSLIKLARSADDGSERAFVVPQGGELQSWVRERTAEKGGSIAPPAIQLLVESVGGDLEALDNELEKLLLYRGGQEPVIKVEDVHLLSPYTAEANIFDLVDALGNRHEGRASALYQKKLTDGEDPFRLFAMFVRQFRLLIQAKELAEAGQRPPAIAKAMGVHGFVAGKLAQQARNYSMSELERIYGHLLDIDIGAKTGEMDMQTALDLLVANLTLAP